MKLDIRWQLLIAVAGFAIVLALLSFQVQTAGFCSISVPTSGGYFIEGIVGAPRGLNPVLSDGYPVEEELNSLIFQGLTRYDPAGELVPVLAESWSVSEDGRTVRFLLREDVTWQDGEPVTTADVAYTYGLLQDDALPVDTGLKRLWQSIVIRPVSEREIEFELKEPYAGFLEQTTRGLLPVHLLEDVDAAELATADFNRQPVGTGPFIVESDDWTRTNRVRLTPRTEVWRQGTQVDGLEFHFFADEADMLEAFQNGDIHAINSVSPTALPAVADMDHGRLFTNLSSHYTSLLFNTSPSGSAATQNPGVRRAMALALDRQQLIDGVLNGQGVLQNGPYLSSSWAYNPGLMTAYGYDPANAEAGLNDAGWTLPEGETIRTNGENRMALRMLVYDTPTNRALAEAIAAQWETAGIALLLDLRTDWPEFRRLLSERSFDVALVDVDPPTDPDLYDFWSQEAIVRGQNYTGWNSRRASEALEEGRKVWAEAARRPFYDTFLRLYNDALPELTLYRHLYTYAATDQIESLAIGRIDQPIDRYESMPAWFLRYRDVPVACATEPA